MSKPTTDGGIDMFVESLKYNTLQIAKELDVEINTNNSVSDILNELIVNVSNKYRQKVVILLDEYDKPYTDFVNDPEMAEKMRDILRSYYSQIKANDQYIRFTFITGISKFAKFGVFSALNSPFDISLSPEYAEMCGLTEAEIIGYFPEYFEETANHLQITTEQLLEKMRRYYNGFSFDSEAKARLYNPFSTLLFFAEKDFSNYWMETGRSKVISDYLKTKNLTVEQFRNYPILKDFARCPGDVDTASPEGFLYQCGYLTLRPGTTHDLSLDYPNTEVLNSMSKLLSQNVLPEHTYNHFQSDLLSAFMYQNVEKLVQVFNSLLAGIPYDDFAAAARKSISDNNYPFKPQEWLYRSTILAFLRGCGVVVVAEMHTSLGRADLVVTHKGKTWVIEIKIAYKGENPAEKAEEALRQIMDKNYAKPYPDAICIGMAIDDSQRQITDVRLQHHPKFTQIFD
jgi:hypothetical protein